MTVEKIDLHPEYGYTFSTCVVASDFVFTSHLAGLDEEGNWPEGIEEQTEHCFRRLEKTLKAAGATLSDVVKMTVLLKDPSDFSKMNEVYRRQFTDGYPARTGIITEFLDSECLIQIEAVANKPR